MDVERVQAAVSERRGVALVVGLGVSGVAAGLYLCRRGLRVRAVDAQATGALNASKYASGVLELQTAGVELHTDVTALSESLVSDVSCAIVSPGVPVDGPVCQELSARGVPWCGELEYAALERGGRQVVVTGSNGKSTTVTLIDLLLRDAGISSQLTGNIGTPLIALLDAVPSPQVTVLEASSYQLESTTRLHPSTAVFLNLSENHLARHGSMQRYAQAKAKIFAHQTKADLAIVGAGDRWALAASKDIAAERWYVGRRAEIAPGLPGAIVDYQPARGLDSIEVRLPGLPSEVLSFSGARLLGEHNRLNMAVALLAASREGVSLARARSTLLTASGLAHRLELVPTGRRQIWINDSKATTVAAAMAGIACVLDAYPERSLTVLLGGQDKGGSWAPLMEQIRSARQRISSCVVFGASRELIAEQIAEAEVPLHRAQTMRDAVCTATQLDSGGVILFSPGCASFDEFEDFEDRGRQFMARVRGISSAAGMAV